MRRNRRTHVRHLRNTSCVFHFALCSWRLASRAGAAASEIPPDRNLTGFSRFPRSQLPPRHSGKVCASLVTWRERTSSSNSDPQKETRSAPRPCGRIGASQCRRHRLAWSAVTRAAKQATTTIPIVMALYYRPCWKRVRRQPRATWRKYHWDIHACPGDKRKTTGASERDTSPSSPAWPSSGLRLSRATHNR